MLGKESVTILNNQLYTREALLSGRSSAGHEPSTVWAKVQALPLQRLLSSVSPDRFQRARLG